MPTKHGTKKNLDQQLVNEFVEWRSLKKKISDWLEETGERIVKMIGAGRACPAAGPYLLALEIARKSNVEWKDEFWSHLKAEFRRAGKAPELAGKLASQQMAKMAKKAGMSRIKKLAVKPNPSFAGDPNAAVVRKIDSRSKRGF
jgi:hypothetical protein